MWRAFKRAASKESTDSEDKVESSASLQNGVGKDNVKPSWMRSLPHVLVATIASFLFGYHLGVINETLESISIDLNFRGNTFAEGLVVSTSLAGAFFGSAFSGWVADGIGRRRALQLNALPLIIGASMSAKTESLEGMLIGRFLVGIGMGLGPPIASLYVTEVSPAYVRGIYGGFTQIATCLGLMGSLFIGLPCKRLMGWWRICFWVSTVPAALLAIFMEYCTESPHWLYKRGRGVEAEAAFDKILGGLHVKLAIADLSKSDRGDDADSVKLSEMFCSRYRKLVLIGASLFALQQLTGINAVFFFSATVIKRAGIPSDFASICVGVINLSGSVVAMLLMDKLGRKTLLIWSFMGMAISMAVQAIAASPLTSVTEGINLSVGGMLLSVMTFSVGAAPVPCLLLSEIFPGQIRAKGMAISMAVHWAVNFFVGLLFLRLLEVIGAQLLYTIFGAFCLLAVSFVSRNIVETKGKTLQEIEIALLPPEEKLEK